MDVLDLRITNEALNLQIAEILKEFTDVTGVIITNVNIEDVEFCDDCGVEYVINTTIEL
jgi:hypothetical protein